MQITEPQLNPLMDITRPKAETHRPGEFDNLLAAASGPPGPEPPPKVQPAPREEKQKTVEPNAQSKKPDFLSRKREAKKPQAEPAHKEAKAPKSPEVPPSQEAKPQQQMADQPAKQADGAAPASAQPTPATPQVAIAPELAIPAEAEAISLKELPKCEAAPIVDASVKTITATAAKAADIAGIKAPVQAAVTEPTPAATKSAAKVETEFAAILQTEQGSAVLQISEEDASAGADSGAKGKEGSETLAAAAEAAQAKPAQNAPEIERTQIQLPPGVTRDVIRQVADRIGAMALKKSTEEVTIQLHPADLGSITLQISNVDNRVEARITTENHAVRHALQENRTQLQQSIASKGLELGKVSVSADAQGQAQAREQQRTTTTTRFSKGPVREATTELRPTRVASSAVDLWI